MSELLADRDLQRLSDYLRRTDSDQDGEALTALRFARSLMKSKGIEWDDLIFQKKTIKPVATLEEKIAFLISNLPENSRRMELIESFGNQYHSKGYLSVKQIDLLNKFYEEAHAR